MIVRAPSLSLFSPLGSAAGARVVAWDLDSTLMNTEARRHLIPRVDPTKSWLDFHMACDLDDPYPGALALNHMLAHVPNLQQHIVTGRDHRAMDETMKSLARHNVQYSLLRMQDRDYSEDDVRTIGLGVKLTYLDWCAAHDIEVVLFIEDRVKIAEAIRATGTPVLVLNPCYERDDIHWRNRSMACKPKFEDRVTDDPGSVTCYYCLRLVVSELS